MFEFVFNLLKIKKNYKNNETEKSDETEKADEIINEIVTIKQNIPAPEYDKCKQFIPLQHGDIAYCSSVYDGDTIRLCWTTNNHNVRSLCRINGIDTPEIRGSSSFEKELAFKAKGKLDKAVTGKWVKIINPGVEKYGRILADIQTDDISSIKDYMLSDPSLAKPYFGGKKESWDS